MKNTGTVPVPAVNAGITHTPLPGSLVWLFAAASGLSVANVYYAQPLLDALARDFAISHAAVGGVITATQIGSALALLLLVPLGDKTDRRNLMTFQLAALILALFIVGLAATLAVLLGGMLAVGMLGTAMTQGLIAYATGVAGPGEQGRVVGAAQGCVFTGLLLARVFSGAVSDLAGWRGVYISSAIMMLLILLPLRKHLPRMAVTQATGSYRQLIVSMVSLLKEQKVLQIRGILAFLMFAAFNIFWSALVIPLSAAPYSFSHTAIGAFGLAGAIGAIAAGSGLGAISATMMYAYAGWNGVCLLGAFVSLLVLLFWRATLNVAG